MHPRARLHLTAAAIVAGLMAALLATAPAAVAKAAPARAAAAATPTLPADLSTRMPRTAHDETVGDFLGKGYDQRAVVENGRLNIYNPPNRGGNLVQWAPTDLQGVGPSNSDGRGGHLPLWQGGAMADLADKSQLASVYLAWTPDALYMAGSHNVGVPGAGSDVNLYFADWLYKLPPDGKCASKSCAIAVGKLPALIYSHSVPFIERTEGVTALAVGQVAGKTFVAIGFSDTEAGTDGRRVGDRPDSAHGGRQDRPISDSDPGRPGLPVRGDRADPDRSDVAGLGSGRQRLVGDRYCLTDPYDQCDQVAVDSDRQWIRGLEFRPELLPVLELERR